MINSETRNTIKLIRNSFERQSIDLSLLKKLYKKYNNIDNIDKFINDGVNMFPKLNCGITSLYIKHILKGGRIINGEYKKENHTFLMYKNNIIDITAEQYGGPKIHVGPLKYPWKIKTNQ